jgi:hypothetical protein
LAFVLSAHPHPDGALTDTDPDPPAAINNTLVGDTVYEHCAGASVTVTAVFAIVIVPLFGVVEVFAATERLTVPEPVPEATSDPTQEAALLTVHAHPAGAVTPTGLVPPDAGNATLVPESEYVHGTPASVTVTGLFAIVSVPVCETEDVFGAIVALIVPEPVPLATLSVIHGTRLEAVQLHDDPVVTAMATVPPLDAGERTVGETT